MPADLLFAIYLVVAIWPAEILATLLHETGHAIAARAMGQTVLCWGVGVRKVLLRIPVRGAILYLGWPLSAGLTLWAPPSSEPSRATQLIPTAGGIVANVIGLAAGLVLLGMGWNSPLLWAWIVASALLCLIAAFPETVHIAGTSFKTDGKKLIDILLRKDSRGEIRVGRQLQHVRAIIQFLRHVRHAGGVARYSASAAILEAALGNLDQARKDLECAEAAGRVEIPCMATALALTRLVIAAEANEEQAPQLAEQMRLAFGSDSAIQSCVDSSLATWRHARGLPIGELVDAIRQRAAAASRPNWTRQADILDFMADPTDAPDVRCRQLIGQHPAMLGVSKISLLTDAASRLAALGQIDRAREFRAEAAAEISREASYIDSLETRTAFVSSTVKRLQSVLPDEPFAVEIPPKPPTVPIVLASKGRALARITLALGAATFLLAVAVGVWDALWPLDDTTAHNWAGPIAFCFFIALVTTVASILSGERQTGTILGSLLLALLGIGIAIAADLNNVRHGRSKPAAHGVLQNHQPRPQADGPG
jgi:hypothetical protein